MRSSEPNYWNLLSDQDKKEYLCLQASLSSPECKNKRNKSDEEFQKAINAIEKYVVRNDGNDWKRGIVCGIVWINDTIATNNNQMVKLFNKSKSSINTSFQRMNYGTIHSGMNSAGELFKIFPFMAKNFAELRQWTLRKKISDKSFIDIVNGIISNSGKKSDTITSTADEFLKLFEISKSNVCIEKKENDSDTEKKRPSK